MRQSVYEGKYVTLQYQLIILTHIAATRYVTP